MTGAPLADALSAPAIPARHTLSGFNAEMGFELISWGEDGHARTRFMVQERHLNTAGIVHGGVLCSFLDFTSGMSGVYTPDLGAPRACVTLSLTTGFVAPARRGPLLGFGQVVGGGRSIFHVDARIEDSEGRLVATAQGAFKRSRPRAA
ncbi:PaaI family thioesterase [Rhodovulum sp. DZ06]|uniref:PaaI family thioesterase n=1 Tax=Rhodovulum sp. DZ06 TaxID=3425126 RepID=UPI003D32D2B2